MKKAVLCVLIPAILFSLGSCGKTENPEVVRQIRNTVSEASRMYSDKYGDTAWLEENYYALFFADMNSYKEIEPTISKLGLKFESLEGLKVYKEVARKDLRYLQADDSYLVRNDFTVIAALKDGSVRLFAEPKTSMQYYRLKKDAKDGGKYKIIETYPAMDKGDFIFAQAFLDRFGDFSRDEAVKKAIEKAR